MRDTHPPADNDPGDGAGPTGHGEPAVTPESAGGPPATVTCSIVVPVHNKASLTRQCLETLLGQADLGIEREIIVVDDGSTDLTPRLLQSYEDRITVVTNSPGKGFAGACNAGAAAATGAYLVFLNNDTLPSRRWLAALVGYAEAHPAAGIVGSKLLYPDDTVQHAGVAIGYDRYPRHLYTGFPSSHSAVNTSRRLPAVTAACLLIRREVWQALEGFDTGYRNGWEDVDLCLRAGEIGHEVHYCHESIVYHLESVSRDVRAPDERANRERYEARWRDKVIPDDLAYYIDDEVLTITYQARYPINLTISPLLATWTIDGSLRESDRLLAERAKQVTILLRNNIVMNTRVHEAELRALDAEQRARAAYQRLTDAGLTIDDPAASGADRPPATATAAPPIIGSLEQPGRVQPPLTEPELTVSGWALSPFGIATIEALIDEQLVHTLDYGVPRPDVAAAHPGYPGHERAGFSGTVSLARFSDGPHELRIRIHDQRGRFADAAAVIDLDAGARRRDRIVCFCDEPASGARTLGQPMLPIRGWALSPHGVREIQVYVNGEPRGSIPYGDERPDVPPHFPDYPDAANSGFAGAAAVSDLADGEHELRLRIIANDGREAELRVPFVVDPLLANASTPLDADVGTPT